MVRIQVRRATAANWTTDNPTLSAGEFGFETDTKKVKIGDGSTAWNSLGYFGIGVTDHTALSNIGTNTHAQIDTFIASKGNANGLASLDSGGKVPVSQLPSSVLGALEYQGTFDASGGSYPASPSKGYYYVCSVAGTVSGKPYAIGDWCVYNGTGWDKVDSADAVTSVDGQTGAVSLATTYVAIPAGTVQGDILYNNGSGITRLGPGTAGQVLKTGGAGANPAWTNIDGGTSSVV